MDAYQCRRMMKVVPGEMAMPGTILGRMKTMIALPQNVFVRACHRLSARRTPHAICPASCVCMLRRQSLFTNSLQALAKDIHPIRRGMKTADQREGNIYGGGVLQLFRAYGAGLGGGFRCVAGFDTSA
jgi:hypothetical protein